MALQLQVDRVMDACVLALESAAMGLGERHPIQQAMAANTWGTVPRIQSHTIPQITDTMGRRTSG
jgi:hypothetical protein